MKTLKELAHLTGFSPATLSRVLNKSNDVNEATRRGVEEALNRIGYEHIRSERKKAFRKTVLIVAGESASLYHTKLYAKLSERLRLAGILPFLAISDFEEAREEEYVSFAQDKGFGGIVMTTAMETPRLKRLVEKSPCPIVLVNRPLRSTDTDVVHTDNYRAGYIAAAHFLERGHGKFICISGGMKSSSSQDRVSGFVDALKDVDTNGSDWLVWDGDFNYASGQRFGAEYAAGYRKYTAVFCVNEAMARGFAEVVLEAGLKIPDDVSVICMTAEPVVINEKLALTCVVNNAELFGETAAQMLVDRMNGLDVAPRKIVYPPQLCTRDSVRNLS